MWPAPCFRYRLARSARSALFTALFLRRHWEFNVRALAAASDPLDGPVSVVITCDSTADGCIFDCPFTRLPLRWERVVRCLHAANIAPKMLPGKGEANICTVTEEYTATSSTFSGKVLRLDEMYVKDITGDEITEVALEQETLSDGSIVFNLVLSQALDPNS